MYDIFYFNQKPNIVPYEKYARNLERAAAQSRTEYFWYVNGNYDFSKFDFWWQPNDYEKTHTHVFSSQWQEHAEVYFRAKTSNEEILNFNQSQKVKSVDCIEKFHVLHQTLSSITNKSVRFIDSYLGTFKRILNKTQRDYIWITSDICKYDNFDFSWHPSYWQKNMIHVFPTNNQPFGDTFYIHVPTLKEQINNISKLEYFQHINYCNDQIVDGLCYDIDHYDNTLEDDIIDTMTFLRDEAPTGINVGRNLSFAQFMPYQIFIPNSKNDDNITIDFNPKLWDKESRSLHKLTPSGSITAIPREFYRHFNTQMYDYPYISTSSTIKDSPLDIVFISNGEPDADKWYDHLCSLNLPNKIMHSKGVDGRTDAYKQAAQMSNTINFFAVFAKLEVDANFDFTWQPDYLQKSKHYIFHAKNPVNNLEYGHMAMIAYNKKLVLNTINPGIDFTLSAPHAVVPLLSGIAHYNVSPLVAWRTAFREVIKLCWFEYSEPTIETSYRLTTWLTKCNSVDNAEWSLRGAKDAKLYFDTVKSTDYKKMLSAIKLSYDWKWLNSIFSQIR